MKKIPTLMVFTAIIACSPAAFFSIAGAQSPQVNFRVEVRFKDMHVTVLDSHGEYLDALTSDDFEVYDNGERCPINKFEPVYSGLSCVILMDRTESTRKDLPVIKNAILEFIDAMREEDRIAVYYFNSTFQKVQDFTDDKNAAKQAVLAAIPMGSTALYDSIFKVADDLSVREGKKVIITFTDGQDNSSFINPQSVIRRTKDYGIPLFFVAKGEALKKPDLVSILKEMSRDTAGETYAIEIPSQASGIFETISRKLQHTYLIGYEPPPIMDKKWRTIRLSLKGYKNVQISAMEGYFPK